MKNGLYALASLDGRPLAPRDLAVMGLSGDAAAGAERLSGCVVLPRDVRAAAIRTRADADGIDALLGDLDEPRDAARLLGLPPATDALTLATRMVDRFGDRAAAQLPGAWALLRWDAHAAVMTVTMAERVRDTCHVATDGVRVAISPELARLARLDWIDATPDPVLLMMSAGRIPLRRGLGDLTFLRGVTRVLPGTKVVVQAGRRNATQAAPLLPSILPPTIRFEEAIEEIDRLLQGIMRRHFERDGDTALSLSGGLDSSLLALYAARQRGTAELTFLTSAAPPAGGFRDESDVAGIVAAHLGIPIQKVVPPAAANVYRPSERIFAAIEGPWISPRHYLDEALEQAAIDSGAAALVNGYGGEMSVSGYGWRRRWSQPVRDIAKIILGRSPPRADDTGPTGWFHPRFSSAALALLPADLSDRRREDPATRHVPGRSDTLGIINGWDILAGLPSWSVSPMLRAVPLFHDIELLRYVGALPERFIRRGGMDRALGRRLMRGALPDAIVMRGKGLAYSPTYDAMLRDQVPLVRTRLRELGSDGRDNWMDMAWIDRTLAQTEAVDRLDVRSAFGLQSSMVFVEFVAWWENATRAPPTP